MRLKFNSAQKYNQKLQIQNKQQKGKILQLYCRVKTKQNSNSVRTPITTLEMWENTFDA